MRAGANIFLINLTGLESSPEVTLFNSLRLPPYWFSGLFYLVLNLFPLPLFQRPHLYLCLHPVIALSALQIPAPYATWQEAGRDLFYPHISDTMELCGLEGSQLNHLKKNGKRVSLPRKIPSPHVLHGIP